MLADPNDRVKFVVRIDSSPAEVAHGIHHVYLLKTQGNSISVSKLDYIIADPNDGRCVGLGIVRGGRGCREASLGPVGLLGP